MTTGKRDRVSPRDYADSIYSGQAEAVFHQTPGGGAVAWKHGSTEWRGACPFHAGSNKTALKLTPSTGRWHCFSCDASGGPIEWMAGGAKGLRGSDLIAAVNRLAVALGSKPYSDLGDSEYRPDHERERKARARRQQAERAEAQDQRVRSSAAASLWGGAEPVDGTPAGLYLSRRRISHRQQKMIGSMVRWIALPDCRRLIAKRYAAAIQSAPPETAGFVVYAYSVGPGDIYAVELDAVTDTGNRPESERWRRTFGRRQAGCTTRLSEGLTGHVLAIAEGPINALAVHSLALGMSSLNGGSEGGWRHPQPGAAASQPYEWEEIGEVRATGSASGVKAEAAAGPYPDHMRSDNPPVLMVVDLDLSGFDAWRAMHSALLAEDPSRVQHRWCPDRAPAVRHDKLGDRRKDDLADLILEVQRGGGASERSANTAGRSDQ